MNKKLIHISLDEEIIKTSDSLKNIALKEEQYTFFILNTKSKNAWNTFVYQMGLIKIKQDFEKFKINLND